MQVFEDEAMIKSFPEGVSLLRFALSEFDQLIKETDAFGNQDILALLRLAF